MNQHTDFYQKTALVTGTSRGIGRAIALTLAQRGMRVLCTGRSASHLQAVVKEIADAGGKAAFFPADIGLESQVHDLFAFVGGTFGGRLDVLVNNAGIGRFSPVAQCTVADLDSMYATNIRGCFLCCREAMKLMMAARAGYIINISSVVGFKGYPNQAGYGATKHAIMGLTKSLAVEAQPYGVRVSAVLPGGVDTGLAGQSRPDLTKGDLLDPHDVAQAVVYLLSLSDRAAVDQIYIRRRTSRPFP